MSTRAEEQVWKHFAQFVPRRAIERPTKWIAGHLDAIVAQVSEGRNERSDAELAFKIANVMAEVTEKTSMAYMLGFEDGAAARDELWGARIYCLILTTVGVTMVSMKLFNLCGRLGSRLFERYITGSLATRA